MSAVGIIISFLSAFFIVVFLFSNLKIKIYGCLEGVDFCGHIDFELHHLKIFTLKLGSGSKHKYSVFKNRGKFYKSLKKYTVSLLEVNGTVGLGDAAVTAVVIGGAYSVFSLLHSIFLNRIKVENLRLNLNPDFEGICFCVELLCIIDVKVVNIIIDVIKVWVEYTRENFARKEEESLLWQSIR